MTEPVTLIVSIDTEEDNWYPARDAITVRNIGELPRLDRELERLGAHATYFTTYQVAANKGSADVIRDLSQRAGVEIGAHLHPWNTPPILLPLTPQNTMLANLPPALQRDKIRTLTDSLTQVLGTRPLSFRAGRWGLDSTTVSALIDCGYRVDSSVTPLRSWGEMHGPSHVMAPHNVYRLDGAGSHVVPTANGPLIEVPASWGYKRSQWDAARWIHSALDRPVLHRMRVFALAARLHILNSLVLNPEAEPLPYMKLLVRRLVQRGVRHLHVAFHSSSLMPGFNPFATSRADVERLYANLSALIESVSTTHTVRFANVGEAAVLLAPPTLRTLSSERTAGATGDRRPQTAIPTDRSAGGMR
jgi:peptidoglycan/xylan/chitin deacetylase (PgdA/CDA1 family)